MNKPLNAHIFDRADDEWYVEPFWVSDALFAAEDFEGGIWDPAGGQGNIIESAYRAGKTAVGTDKIDRKCGFGARDFFATEFFGNHVLAPNIVTNPPFGRAVLAEKFIRHALSFKPQKLAVFVDSRFLFGKSRANGLFAEFPPARIWLITPRPSCPPGAYLAAGNKAGSGTADYCWLIFSLPHKGPTELRWLNCDKEIGHVR